MPRCSECPWLDVPGLAPWVAAAITNITKNIIVLSIINLDSAQLSHKLILSGSGLCKILHTVMHPETKRSISDFGLTTGGRGIWTPPILADIICEQPLMVCSKDNMKPAGNAIHIILRCTGLNRVGCIVSAYWHITHQDYCRLADWFWCWRFTRPRLLEINRVMMLTYQGPQIITVLTTLFSPDYCLPSWISPTRFVGPRNVLSVHSSHRNVTTRPLPGTIVPLKWANWT